MTENEIRRIVVAQREFFYKGTTLDIRFRMKALRKLQQWIKDNEENIGDAIYADLGKSHFESYMCETGLTLSEISHMIKNLPYYAREHTVATPLAQFASRSYTKPSPYGVTLIMSPWNYPFLLTIEPLVDALAAGNTAVVKPSAYSPNTSKIIKEMIEECFPPQYVSVVMGGRAENQALLEQHFDYIFFTGSKAVGQEVQRKAANYLTPVTLELGGKSPCIVDSTANLKLAAKRIVFGKYLNLGQTCVAPDYLYCDEVIKDELIAEIKAQIQQQFGMDPLGNDSYGRIVNEKHFNRINGLIDPEKVVHGGYNDPETLQIAPTVMDNVTWDDAVMKEEIFGPILPVVTFTTIDEVIKKVNSMDAPLALYYFSSNKKSIQKVTSHIGFGGGCINDTIIHLATSNMGFGGFGASGMGSYHGLDGFRTFSHYKSIVDKKTWIDLPMRYQKYLPVHERLIHMFMK